MPQKKPPSRPSEFIHPSKVKAARSHLIDSPTATHLAQTFEALADPTRVRIIAALSHTDLCVGDLAALLGMTPSAISHQLRLMRAQRLVKARKDGRLAFYMLDDDHIHDLFHRGLAHVAHQ
jgi:ArsR family transcriptional regulator